MSSPVSISPGSLSNNLFPPSGGFTSLCSLYLFTMTTFPNYWTLLSNGQRYTFDTYRELKEFSQQLSNERRQRFEQNVQPWIDYSPESKTVTEYQY